MLNSKENLEVPKSTYCFDEEEFKSDNFDPAAFLSKAQLSHPLEHLRNDLHSYLEELKKKLYDLINRDYADLVAVSSRLVGVDEKAAALSTHLQEGLRQVERIQANAGAAATALEAKVAQRRQARSRRQTLQRSLRFAQLVTATEHLVGLRTSADPEDEDEEKENGSTLLKPLHKVAGADENLSDADEDMSKEEDDCLSNSFQDFAFPSQGETESAVFQKNQNATIPAASSSDLDERCAVLERAAHNVVMLITERGGPTQSSYKSMPGRLPVGAGTANKDDVPPVIQSMALRAQRCEVEVARQLEGALSAVLAGCRQAVADESYTHQVDRSALLHCLRSFCLLGQGPRAEALIALQVMKPFLDITFTQGQLDGKVRGSCSGLPAIYSQTLAFVRRAGGQLLLITEDLLGKMNAGENGADVDFICNGIWRPTFEAIQTKLGAIFAAGLADAFHTNYNLSIQFLEDLSGVCGDGHKASIRRRLQEHPSVKEFMSKWNLPIYFQLRFGEITTQIDKIFEFSEKEGLQSMPEPDSETKKTSDNLFDFAVLQQTWDSIQQCWSKGVFLRPLAHKFLRLTAQILRRYEVWVTGQAWKRTLEDLVLVSFETKRFYTLMKGEFTEQLVTQLDSSHSEASSEQEGLSSMVREFMEEACNPGEAIVGELWGNVMSYLTSECTKLLQAVRGITATYRMTNKPAPKSPSPFVKNILQPLKDFLSNWAEKMPDLASTDWKEKILEAVTCKYKENVLELLTTVQQMEETLKKRRSKAKQKALDKGLSDTDKMLLQLLFDVKEYGNGLEKMGLNLADCESYQQLLKEVQPAERFLK